MNEESYEYKQFQKILSKIPHALQEVRAFDGTLPGIVHIQKRRYALKVRKAYVATWDDTYESGLYTEIKHTG